MYRKKKTLLTTLGLSLLLFSACGTTKDSATNEQGETLTPVTLVLDYVPNTNHTGIYVAKEKGYFEDNGIDLTIIEPGEDNTSLTLLGGKKAQFAVTYQEDLTYSAASKEPIPVTAIATIMEHNTSGLVSDRAKNINSPADFEGKVYAGWQSASEEAVLAALMAENGSDLSKLTLVGDPGGGFSDLEKNVDLKWYFEGWDLVKATMDGYDLNYMPLRELDERLDYYTPVIAARNDVIEDSPELVQAFMDATKKGYIDTIDNPEESVKALHNASPDQDIEFLTLSQNFLSKNYTSDKDNWGVMKESVWDNYTNFMYEHKLIDEPIDSSKMYTNEFILSEENK